MRSLGLDIGDRRIGIALSDPMGMLATPLLVLQREEDKADVAAILQIVSRHQAEMIIVGLPHSMNGTIGAQAEKVQLFTEKLRQQSKVPVEFRDERLTTVAAKNMLEEAGARKHVKHRRINYDAAAAAVILQSYLNESRPLEFPPLEPLP